MIGNQIQVRGLDKRYPPRVTGGEGLHVLRCLDVAIGLHEFVCILGPSGCGKSTLLGILAGLDDDFEGSITIAGQPMRRGRPPVRIGYMFQEPRLLPWLTAEANVDFALANCRVPRNRWSELKDRYFTITNLNDFRAYYPHQLSGGMRQRAALVRALVIEPEILLMDEPFSGLDELTARNLRVDLLGIWRDMPKTIVFVTHNAYEASFLADRILIMSSGVMREQVPVRIPRPRDYDDPAVFEVNRRVVRTFLDIVGPGSDTELVTDRHDEQLGAASLVGRAASGG